MIFSLYLISALACFLAACLTPNQGQAFGLVLLAVLIATAAAVQGNILK